MIKAMIVDDEQIVRDGIRFIIDGNYEDIEIVGMAKSGREAIELFEEQRPQIVLMDIQMPGINGIEAMRSIRDMDSRVRFIIISAYEQFEYAKNAVALGVEAYILKPINKQKLMAAIDNAVRGIKEERRSKRRELEIQEKLDQVLPALEHGYIYSIIMNRDFEEESKRYNTLLDIHGELAYMMVIELGEEEAPIHASNRIGTAIKGEQAYNSIRNTIKYKCKAIVGPMMVNRIAVLVYGDMPEDEYRHRVRAIELAEELYNRISKLTGTEVYIGIGGCYCFHRMNISYGEAVKALGKMTDEQVLHIKDAVSESRHANVYRKIKSDEEIILQKMEEGNVGEVRERLTKLFSRLQEEYSGDVEGMQNIVTELMVLVMTAGYRSDSLESAQYTAAYVEDISRFKSFYDLQNWCIAEVASVAEAIAREKGNRVSAVISEAMAYIQAQYPKDLRLKDVAEVVAISPQYFSKIFKKELGVNFIDYLTEVRMGRAKAMLREGRLTIKEICYEIGYNDPNYFSRLFKKVEGVSPTDYV